MHKRRMAWAAGAAMILATACGGDTGTTTATTTPLTPVAVPAGAQRAIVVAGGDTAKLLVRFSDGQSSGVPAGDVGVTLIGVEWPGRGECFAAEADAFAAEALPIGATIHLVADVQDASPDGVLQRYAWDSTGELYNAKALRQGFAKAAPTGPNDKYRVELFEAEFDAKGAGRGIWGCQPESSPTTGTPTGGTTPVTRPPVSAPGTTVAPPETTVPDTVPAGRSVSRGQSFSMRRGETVNVTGEGLTVTLDSIQDSRCPPFPAQCVVAGDASISVTLAKAGSSPATLSIGLPGSGQYLSYTVELIGVGRFSPSATLMVS